jgi:hypothetical protein
MRKYIIAFVVILLFLNSCRSEFFGIKIEKVGYGTSFGECVGYCSRKIEVKSDEVTYTYTSWVDSLKPLTATENLNIQTWDSIRNNLNVNSFFQLNEFIGCPDCADGGAEWIEILLSNGEKHHVTFEYHNVPIELKQYIPTLRNLLNKNDLLEK